LTAGVTIFATATIVVVFIAKPLNFSWWHCLKKVKEAKEVKEVEEVEEMKGVEGQSHLDQDT